MNEEAIAHWGGEGLSRQKTKNLHRIKEQLFCAIVCSMMVDH